MFETVVLFHARGVGQHDRIAGILQSIDQPIPVIGRFDGQLGDLRFVGFDDFENGGQMARQFPVPDSFALVVHQSAKGVVAVPVDSSHDLHRGSPVG